MIYLSVESFCCCRLFLLFCLIFAKLPGSCFQ
jgi:hypothetical protein